MLVPKCLVRDCTTSAPGLGSGDSNLYSFLCFLRRFFFWIGAFCRNFADISLEHLEHGVEITGLIHHGTNLTNILDSQASRKNRCKFQMILLLHLRSTFQNGNFSMFCQVLFTPVCMASQFVFFGAAPQPAARFCRVFSGIYFDVQHGLLFIDVN